MELNNRIFQTLSEVAMSMDPTLTADHVRAMGLDPQGDRSFLVDLLEVYGFDVTLVIDNPCCPWVSPFFLLGNSKLYFHWIFVPSGPPPTPLHTSKRTHRALKTLPLPREPPSLTCCPLCAASNPRTFVGTWMPKTHIAPEEMDRQDVWQWRWAAVGLFQPLTS